MSMFKNLFNPDKSNAKQKAKDTAEAGGQGPVGGQLPQADGSQASSGAVYEPISPNIDTNPDPGELALEDGGAERYWDENGNPVADGYYNENGEYMYNNDENENAEGYLDENGRFVRYGSEQDTHGYYDENGEYVYYSEGGGSDSGESAEGYWDENGSFIYYGSEDDPNGYYNESGEYIYYAERENAGGYYDENGEYIYYANAGGGQAASDKLEPQKEKSYSVIADETIVTGNIQTAGHIDIVGEVLGNVDAGGNVAVLGSVSGNVSSEKMGLEDCRINGNLKASVGIVASSTSTIVGNVRTKNLLLDGKLKGNINVDNVVVLRKNAYFLGDIQAGQIAIEMGAVFNGNIKMLTQGDPDEPFYEAM